MERNVTASEQSIYSSYREMLLEQKDVGSSPITRSPKKPMESRRTATQGEWPVVVILVMCTECVPNCREWYTFTMVTCEQRSTDGGKNG